MRLELAGKIQAASLISAADPESEESTPMPELREGSL
jgi:hypothetical protein